MGRAVFCEAYKKKVYGDRFQWLIVGMYEAAWWTRGQPDLTCSPAEVRGCQVDDNTTLGQVQDSWKDRGSA